VRAFAHDAATYPLPPGHRFPLGKYRLVRESVERLSSVQVEPARQATRAELARTHTADWLDRVAEGRLTRREELALGLPWSDRLAERSRLSTGATIQAAEAALEDGVAANLGGGTHHAFAGVGRGFCVFNDVVTALRALRAGGQSVSVTQSPLRALVLDLDVHQGDGTHSLLAGDPHAFTVSVNGGANYPFRRVPGDLELDLPDGTGDDRYLAELEPLLAEAVERSQPDLCFLLAGADPYAGDRLGRLALTKDGLAERDRLARDTLRAAGVPVCVTLAGGYGDPIEDTVDINVETIRTFAA
jgi:acetoin utilization deacetylase AcuC-like enzyme